MLDSSLVQSAEVIFCRYSLHTKPFQAQSGNRPFLHYYIRWQTEGYCEAIINGQLHFIRPGDLLLFRPGDRCQLLFVPNKRKKQIYSGNYYLVCRGNWIEKWWNAADRPLKTNIPLDENLLTIFKLIEKEFLDAGYYWKEATSNLLKALCIYIDRLLKFPSTGSKGQALALQKMKDYIAQHASNPIKVKDVADAVGLSESRASHIFKAGSGETIIGFVLTTRLRNAIQLMQTTDEPLELIAKRSGFGSYSYFHRAFLKRYGMTPKQFRQEHIESEYKI